VIGKKCYTISVKLVIPSIQYEQEYFDAIEESKHEAGMTLLPQPEIGQTFEEFVQNKIDQSRGINLPEGFVPSTEFWLIDNDEFIGRTNIRHYLNDWLLQIGGHIGYWIRPSRRGKGYGTKILELGLQEAKKLGLANVLVTCDITNQPSGKVIETNGGVLENIVPNGQDNPPKKRYWINNQA
jgi:predicted acetyltransferase